ncbi:hypothetical protein L195_g046964 [Trifolium pratense]|uniref:Uncharacterized protein n=1 Tax=Trifolium pratense TaxID=57577 RepID=A0A2K3MJ70_TRIPR|nr:hypothetical protein L195_g046964 [Trifolium pratense]
MTPSSPMVTDHHFDHRQTINLVAPDHCFDYFQPPPTPTVKSPLTIAATYLSIITPTIIDHHYTITPTVTIHYFD